MQRNIWKNLFVYLLYLLLLFFIGVAFYYLSIDTYKKLLVKEIEIPNVTVKNSSKTTFLKILSKNNDIMYLKYFNYGGLIDIDEDFEGFKRFERGLKRVLGYDPVLNKFWQEYLKGKTPFFINRKIEKFLKTEFYKRLLERYRLSYLYEKVLNDYKFSDGIIGVNGYSLKCFGKPFASLKFEEKVFVSLCSVLDLKDVKKHFSYLAKLTSLIVGNDRLKITFNSPPYINKSSEYKDLVFMELGKLKIDLKKHFYVVRSAFDEKLYRELKKRIKEKLKKYKGVEAGFVLIDYRSKVFKVVIGGINGNHKFNRAVRVKREVGSVFKPVTYLTAFANGIRPSAVLEDKRYKFYDGGRIYSPKNFKDFYMGKTNVRNGLIYSLNNLTVKLAVKVGLRKVSKMASKLGFENVRPFYAMPLGSIPQTPLTVAKAYSVLANYGEKCKIKAIYSLFEDGKKVDISEKCQSVVDDRSAYQVLFLMKKVVKYGTARGKGLIPGTAGKTGTSNNSRDCWFVGIFPPYVAVLWVGYDDFRVIDDDATGGKVAAPVVADIEKYLLKGVSKINFRVPKGIVMKKVVKNHDLLYRNGCGRYYFEMLKSDNLPPICNAGGKR